MDGRKATAGGYLDSYECWFNSCQGRELREVFSTLVLERARAMSYDNRSRIQRIEKAIDALLGDSYEGC